MKVSNKNIYIINQKFFQTGADWKNYFLLLLITILTYWPLSFGVYSLKNDALLYFLPWRVHISDIVHSGSFPFWDPYLFTGLPLHSEMPSGSWNPIVLFVSLFTRYNMSVLECELLFYIFVGSIGMYKLIKAFGYSSTAAFICSLSYLCCGFITDTGSFISWINCAAYIPFCFLYFYKCITAYSLANSIKLGLALFLLFTTCDPSYFILSSYIMAFGFLSWLIVIRPGFKNLAPVLKHIFIAALLFLILSAPAIFSYLEFLPYYKRGAGASLQQSLTDPFPPFSLISFFSPNAVVKKHEWLNTDIAMRNASVGILIFLFLLVTVSQKLTNFQRFISLITVLSLLFSFGDYFVLREWCYNYLPLMNIFRHPANARLFTTLGIIILASASIHTYFAGTINLKKIKTSGIAIAILLLWIIIYYSFIAGGSAYFTFNDISRKLANFTFGGVAAIQAVIQLVFIITFILFIKRRFLSSILIAANLILFANMSLPFTFISKSRTKAVDAYISNFPGRFPVPSLNDSIESDTYSTGTTDGPYGYSKFYSKRIVIQDNIISPTVNSDYATFLNEKQLRMTLNRFPWAFISSPSKLIDSSAALSVTNFHPTAFTFHVQSATKCELNIIQQYNHNWKASVNNKKVSIQKSQIAFMKVAVPAGSTEIKLAYTPGTKIMILMYISLFTLIVISFFLAITKINHATRQQKNTTAAA